MSGHSSSKERAAFLAWAREHIKENPDDWLLLDGHDKEDRWAFLAWQAARTAPEPRVSGCAEPEPCVSHLALTALEREVVSVLDSLGPLAVRVREGGGDENIAASLAVSIAKLLRASQPPPVAQSFSFETPWNEAAATLRDSDIASQPPRAIPDQEFEELVTKFGIAISRYLAGDVDRNEATAAAEAVLRRYYSTRAPIVALGEAQA